MNTTDNIFRDTMFHAVDEVCQWFRLTRCLSLLRNTDKLLHGIMFEQMVTSANNKGRTRNLTWIICLRSPTNLKFTVQCLPESTVYIRCSLCNNYVTWNFSRCVRNYILYNKTWSMYRASVYMFKESERQLRHEYTLSDLAHFSISNHFNQYGGRFSRCYHHLWDLWWWWDGNLKYSMISENKCSVL